MDKKKSQEILIIIRDGLNGILALMIYNFLLYISGLVNGLTNKIREETGYFYLNSFIDMGFGRNSLIISLIIVFAVAFLLGVITGKIVRKLSHKKY